MTKILFSSFSDALTATIVDIMCRNSWLQVTAVLSASELKACALNATVKRLRFGSSKHVAREVVKEIDAVVGLFCDERLKDLAHLAVRYNRPLIYSAPYLTNEQKAILQDVSRYTPVVFYDYQQASLPEIVARIAQYTLELDKVKTGAVISQYA